MVWYVQGGRMAAALESDRQRWSVCPSISSGLALVAGGLSLVD